MITTLLCVTGIVLANVLMYWRTIKYRYVSDDIISAYRTPEKNPFWHYFWVLEGKLKSVSFKKMSEGTNHILSTLPRVDHIINIVLHVLTCVGIYLGFGANPMSLAAALLFSFCPMNNQGVVWISARSYTLAALAMVWCLALPTWIGGIPLLIATYTNAGFLMPLVLVGSTHWPLLVLLPLLWWFWLPNFRKNVVDKINMEVHVNDKVIHPKKLILGFKTFGFYLFRGIIPMPATFYHHELESLAGSGIKRAYSYCPLFWTGVLGFLAMLVYVCLTPWSLVSLGLLWFCLGVAPFCNLYRMQQELADRYVYVANVGLMVAMAALLIHWPILLGLWIGAFAATTWQFIPAYQDDFWLVEQSRMNDRRSWFAWHIAAMKRFEVGSHQEAVMFWTIARQLSPKEFKILYNLASATAIVGNYCTEPQRTKMIQEAFQWLKVAGENIPPGQETFATNMIEDFKKGKIAILT